MQEAWFITRAGMVAGALATSHGPFESEAEALSTASKLPPASYTVFGPTAPGKQFEVAAPVVTFKT